MLPLTPEQAGAPLRNQKHELFSQLVASGMRNQDAYERAGFKRDRHNAARLHTKLRPRIDTLMRARERAAIESAATAQAQPWLTRDYVIDALRENAERAMQATPVLDAKGAPTGEYRWDGSVANKALELLGKELGMFIERRSIDQTVSITEDQITEADRILAESAAKLKALRATKAN